MTDAVEAEHLVKSFKGSVRALDGLSFAVRAGSVFGLLGPNGAGKTTAVRILTTILTPDEGTARVLGHDVITEARTVRGLIGLAGQYAAVDENLTGRENLDMVGSLNHLPRPAYRQRTRELLVQFQLDDAGDRPLKTYSGGMRRRLDVAAALVARPAMLFLDEPTTGLDPASRSALWIAVEELVSQGTTVLLTTQYMEEADRLAHEIAVVDHGTVIALGTPARLKAQMGATVLDIGLAGAADAAHTTELLRSTGRSGAARVGDSVELGVDDGPRAAIEILRLLDQAGIEPHRFTLREPTLDDVFLSLTGNPTADDGLAGADPDRASFDRQRSGDRGSAPGSGRGARRGRRHARRGAGHG